MSTFDISAVARMSGIQETASQMNMISRGRMRAPSTESLKVCTHRKVTAGAALMFVTDQYPVAPEMAHPTARPRMMEADFMRGEPNCSTMITETKTENPRPMSLGSPLWAALAGTSYFGVGNPPNKRLRRVDVRTQGIIAYPTIAVATPTPILHPIAYEVHAHE